MPFLKDEEGLACERERKALQEEEHPMQRQSQGMNRIKSGDDKEAEKVEKPPQ